MVNRLFVILKTKVLSIRNESGGSKNKEGVECDYIVRFFVCSAYIKL
jgi:hypothetical protein